MLAAILCDLYYHRNVRIPRLLFPFFFLFCFYRYRKQKYTLTL